jgi:hypothetical protein
MFFRIPLALLFLAAPLVSAFDGTHSFEGVDSLECETCRYMVTHILNGNVNLEAVCESMRGQRGKNNEVRVSIGAGIGKGGIFFLLYYSCIVLPCAAETPLRAEEQHKLVPKKYKCSSLIHIKSTTLFFSCDDPAPERGVPELCGDQRCQDQGCA